MSRRRKAKQVDVASQYAYAVTADEVVAGPGIRGACERHLKDLENQGTDRFPYVWDANAADRVQGFFENHLRLSIGETEGQTFKLLPWQKFYLRSIFAWKHNETGYRRFRSVYLETSKSSGKSQLNAGIGMYMLVADNERHPQVYVMARDRNQALVLFMYAVEFVRQSQLLNECIEIYGGNNPFNMTYKNPETGNWGFFRRIATQTDAKGSSGPIPSCALIDEIHELHSGDIIESMRAGAKTRRQPLLLMSTNSGESQQSIGWEYHEHALKVAIGDREDNSHFAMVFNGDVDDNPIEDESVWVKTNPSLPLLPSMEFLRAQVSIAKSMPSKINFIRRLNFGEWIDSSTAWIESSLYEACERESLPDMKDKSVVAAFDLSQRRDLTAGVAVWRGDNGRMFAKAKFWLPEEGLLEREREDRVPYGLWRDMGVLSLTPGRVVDYEWPARWLVELMDSEDVRGVAYDSWRAYEFLRILGDLDVEGHMPDDDDSRVLRQGIPVYKHSQGKKRVPSSIDPSTGLMDNGLTEGLCMPQSIDHLEYAILKERIEVESNPCLRWNVCSAVIEANSVGDRSFEKHRSNERIDGAVALAMAVGLARALPMEEVTRGPLVYAM